MKINVTECKFIDAFQAARPENFSYTGLKALFEYLEDLEADMGEEMELDVIAICCEWVEATAEEIQNDFNLMEIEDAETALQENTQYIKLDNGDFLYIAW